MSKTNEKIKEILSLLNQIRNDIGSVVVYQKEVILVRTIVISSIRSIMKSPLMTASEYTPDESKEFKKFKNTLQGLHDLVRMLSGDVWTSVALEWPVQKPTNDLEKYMLKMSEQLSKLGIEIPKYSPTEDDISADYLAIFKIFQSAKGTETKVVERLNSISKFLVDHGIEIPPSPESAEIRTIFDEIPQFHVERDDFKLENQIGRGSSGIVYKAKQISTGRIVAVKELTSMNLDKYEVASLRREVLCLSTLKYKYLIDFIGATTTSPYWIVTTFMPGDSLFARLRDKKDLSPYQLTVIAYEIAEGMAYLHSKNIIHRDLKTLNILLDEKMEPRICDFGISRQCENMMTGLVGTFNYMAPEIIAKTGYNLKADVFSYGMMLWEMLRGEIPFNDLGPMNAGKAILNGQRPPIPRSTPKPLQQLIKDCWQVDIERRPSFNEILTRMRKEIISFPDADQNELKKFYIAKSEEIKKNEKVKKNVLQSISMCEENINELTNDILNCEYDYKYTQELISMMNCDDLIKFFIQNKGIKAIKRLFKLKNKEAPQLLLHISKYLDDDEYKKLFKCVMKCDDYETAEKMMNDKKSIDYTKLIQPFISKLMESDSKFSNSQKNLLNFFILNQNANMMPKLKLKDAIALQSFDSIEKLIKCNSITISNDTDYLIGVITSSKNEKEQLCAVRVALCFNDEAFSKFADNSNLISAVIKLTDLRTIGKFLYRICQIESGSKNVLSHESFLKSNLSSPFILMVFIQIARYNGQKVISLSWFTHSIFKQLQERSNIEIILRICGVLSLEPSFSEKKKLLTQLLTLLKDSEYSGIEIPLLIGIFYNCKFKAIDVYYSQFLSLASQNTNMAGKAFKILAGTELPKYNSRNCARIFDLIETFYEKGNDIDGISAACNIMKQMSSNESYKKIASNRNFDEKMNIWIQKLKNTYLITLTLENLILFEYKADQRTIFAIELAISKVGDSEEKFNKLSNLYKSLK